MLKLHERNRAEALFTAWRCSRTWTTDLQSVIPDIEDKDQPGYVYNGLSYLFFVRETGKYYILAGNQDADADTLNEAERWLWNNHERFERGADEV